MNKNSLFLLLSFSFLTGTSSLAQEKSSTWLQDSLIRKAVAVSELSHHIDGTMTDLKSAVTYQNTTKKYGPTLYRVELDYTLVWQSGMAKQKNDYLVLLKSDGSTEIHSDNTYFLKELVGKQFPDFETRKDFILDTFSDGMMSAKFGEFLPMAQAKAEQYVATKTPLKVYSAQTLVTGLSVQSLTGKNLLYRFEVVAYLAEKLTRQNILVLVNPENSAVEIFEEDPKYNSTSKF